MGIGCVSKPERDPSAVYESQVEEALEENEWTEENATEQVDKLLKDMQEHNLKRMKDEIETDINTFVLNNLLMCIQFFDNFERSKDAANQFKRDKESEINAKLTDGPNEGMILGERRCHLLHGMGQVLAQNYIYRPPDNAVEEEYYGSFYYGSDPRNTFMCEGILPLEFTMTWDNLEVYQSSEWDTLQAIQYSSAKGVPPISRFFMEEPDTKNIVPRGFVRLRCADVPSDIYKPNPDSNYDYAYGSKYSDRASVASEADSEEKFSDMSVSDIDEDFMENVKMHGIQSNSNLAQQRLPNANVSEEVRQKPFSKYELSHEKFANSRPTNANTQNNFAERFKNRRPSGVLPENYPQRLKPKPTLMLSKLSGASSEPDIPSVRVNPSYTPPVTDNQIPVFNYHQLPNNTLIPPISKRTRQSISLQNINGQSSSSGYERSNGLNTSAMSRSSSVASEDIRHKWRQVELKQLWQYQPRNRANPELGPDKQEPLSSKCFIPMKLEVLSSDDESEVESSSDDEKVPAEAIYETRYYLNSSQFSSEYCSEFNYIGSRAGLQPNTISQAVVLGTTVRCAVPYVSEEDNTEDFHVVYTFTPSLHSKNWPSSYYFWFNQRMFNRKKPTALGESWPSPDQVESIEKLGAAVVPLGLRSIDFFNTHQSLEWQLNFVRAETQLLNTLKSVHWRTYVFSSLIFRAFLAPLGPQGIGIDHIRNILYFMCHEDFVGWNDEQPGVHLRAVLSKLYDCLAKGKMPNFFIQSQDLLKSIPSQNARLVQAHLSHIRENLIIYCIYAFRNLTCVHPNKSNTPKFYPTPNFKKLYSILTVPNEKDLLQIQTPGLFLGMGAFEDESTPKKKTHKNKSSKFDLNLIENEAMIEDDFRSVQGNANRVHVKPDKRQMGLRKKHIKYQQEMRERERQARVKEFQRQKADPDAKIPTAERRKSIDLKQQPVIQERFSTLRKALLIEFFIKHFIEMAKKSNEFRAYAQSSMYILQVENLCEIMLDPRYDLGQAALDAVAIEEYKSQCGTLRDVVGKEIREYVLSRLSHRNIPSLSTHNLIGELSPVRGPFHSNWDFRKLPTPPGSHADLSEWETKKEAPAPKKVKKLETPNIAKSLQSIAPIPSENSSAKLARRAESIKFIDKPVNVIKRTASRQSVILDTTDTLNDSTDL